jgi:hypothetical protein
VDPICILDWKVKVLKNKSIGRLKVQWTCYSPKYATWENEENMWAEYPQFFDSFEEDKM